MNYDINILDELFYSSDGKHSGGWKFAFYTILDDEDDFGTGEHALELDLSLTAEESLRLTLGISESDGGDYLGDDDFWIDVEGFFDTYSDIPERVRKWLENLPEYS